MSLHPGSGSYHHWVLLLLPAQRVERGSRLGELEGSADRSFCSWRGWVLAGQEESAGVNETVTQLSTGLRTQRRTLGNPALFMVQESPLQPASSA